MSIQIYKKFIDLAAPYLILGSLALIFMVGMNHALESRANAQFNEHFRQLQKHGNMILAFAEKKLAIADSAFGASIEYKQDADSVMAAAAVKEKNANARLAALRNRPVPDTCKTIVAEYEVVIAEKDSVISDLHVVITKTEKARASLQTAAEAYKVRGDSAIKVIEELQRLPKPKKQRFGFGPFGGVCSNGQACVGVGASFHF